MKKYKDYLYDWNDCLVVLAILVVAAGLIIWRIAAIADYPKTLAKETGTDDTTQSQAVTEKEQPASDGNKTQAQTDSLWADGALTKDVTVTVSSGSASGAVQSLIDAKLFTSYEQYETACKTAGCTPENIKATTFTFAKGSTRTDIAKKVTS